MQQWAKAAKCATVAWVRRMMERVGTCLEIANQYLFKDHTTEGKGNSNGTRRQRQGRVADKCVFINVCYTLLLVCVLRPSTPTKGSSTYFSSSFNLATSNDSSQPTSIKTFTPPSSSSSDCEADDSDCAPSSEQNVNMLSGATSLLEHLPPGHLLIACHQVRESRMRGMLVVRYDAPGVNIRMLKG